MDLKAIGGNLTLAVNAMLDFQLTQNPDSHYDKTCLKRFKPF